MKITGPSVTIMDIPTYQDALLRIELAGRTCYKSEDRMTETSAEAFVRRLIGSKHESVIEHVSMTARFVVDRGVSHELVRHRLASFSQESTRYVNYGKTDVTFILPEWISPIQAAAYLQGDKAESDAALWIRGCEVSEKQYLEALSRGWSPQKARCFLNHSVKTEVVMTANFRECRHILRERTSTKAHPQMREVMVPLLRCLQVSHPVFFEDIQCDGM